jgi:hypothetical protein
MEGTEVHYGGHRGAWATYEGDKPVLLLGWSVLVLGCLGPAVLTPMAM